MRSIFAAILLLCTAGAAEGRELANRLGVGYADQFGLNNTMPGIAARYYPTSDIGVMGVIGVDTKKDQSQFGFMAKLFKIIFKEDNMNFYVGAGVGLVSQQSTDGTTSQIRNDSGFMADGYFGTEFFFSGLENLGFAVEAGVGVTSISSQVRFRTIGDSPFRAGITFYF